MMRHLMKGIVCVAVLALASTAFAGDYHSGTSLLCYDCHVMHYSQSHGYNANGSGIFTPLNGGPHEFLLRDDVNNLCLACHEGQNFAPDVFEANTQSYVRQAGALNEEGGNGLYPPTTGHSLNSTAIAPGSNPPWSDPNGLNCANCHSVHGGNAGGNSYRNLGGYGTAVGSALAISYSRGDVEGANPLTTWVHEDASSGANVNHYGYSGITFNEPDQTTSQYANFCKGCHTDFHGAVGGTEIGGVGDPAEEFHRHPAGGVDIGAVGGGHSRLTQVTGNVNQVQMLSPTGQKAGSYDGTDTGLTPSCMSCHKGHGNQNAFGLIYMHGAGGTITEQGSGGDLRMLCRQCHGMGADTATPTP